MSKTKEDTAAARREFARRLQNIMNQKGFNQTELAAACRMQSDLRFERDTISTYIRALALPSPKRLLVLAKVLTCEVSDLLPTDFVPPAFTDAPRTPSRDMKSLPDGNVWVTINQAVPFDVALELMKLVKDAR